MIKIIVFDFDGVLVDSNQLKREAWFSLFPPKINQVAEKVLPEIGERSRFEILQRIFEETGELQENIASLVNLYAEKYNEKVQRGILDKGLLPEVLETIKLLAGHYRLYLNSGTPESALKESADNLKISQFFQGIYGKPAAKEENLQKIISREKASAKEVLFVGDGEEDYQAARKFGCFFVGLVNDSNNWQNKDFPLISDLKEIRPFL